MRPGVPLGRVRVCSFSFISVPPRRTSLVRGPRGRAADAGEVSRSRFRSAVSNPASSLCRMYQPAAFMSGIQELASRHPPPVGIRAGTEPVSSHTCRSHIRRRPQANHSPLAGLRRFVASHLSLVCWCAHRSCSSFVPVCVARTLVLNAHASRHADRVARTKCCITQ